MTFTKLRNLAKLAQSEITIKVRCTCEPRGDNGLEGFQLNDFYHASVNRKGNVILYSIPRRKNDVGEHLGTTGIKIASRYFAVEPDHVN